MKIESIVRWVFLSLLIAVSSGCAKTVSNDLGWSLNVDAVSGKFLISVKDPAWTVGGTIGKHLTNLATSDGEDRLGSYHQISFSWHEEGQRTGWIRLYNARRIALFNVTFDDAVKGSPAAFPVLSELPPNLMEFRYGEQPHLRPEVFHLAQTPDEQYGGPFALFDAQANALILSPANDFMIAMLSGDQKQGLRSGLNRTLESVPAGYAYQTLLAVGPGINQTWDQWGNSLTDLYGKKRPANDADLGLKYLGYWTDNGAGYYYNYDLDKGYAGTLLALKDYLAAKGVPIHYMQLDSWWYPKTFNSFQTSTSDKPRSKDPRLPAGTWNRYGGMLEYTASPDLFPDGLGAFQKKLDLPLITHSRWIDADSPYQKQYKISSYVSVDPKWWDKIISDIAGWGVFTYEQDWSNYIYNKSPQLSSTTWAGEAFLDEMAKACAANGLSMQYCMVLPRFVMQGGAKYANFTTLRVSDDRLERNKWREFVYGSVMAKAVGVWPFTDVFRSKETPNILIATLSAGMVGLSDLIGEEDLTNIFQSVRKDGLIVKPDVPLTPTDGSFIDEGSDRKEPTVCATHTILDGGQAGSAFYIFAFQKKQADAAWSLDPASLGMKGRVFAYDYFNKTGRLIDAGNLFSDRLGKEGWTYWIMTPVGESGMSLIGDTNLFVTRGRNRIAAVSDQQKQINTTVLLAAGEQTITLSVYAPAKPDVQVKNGTCQSVTYDAGTGIAEAKIAADADQGGQVEVTFELP
jgi:hypothetical protein